MKKEVILKNPNSILTINIVNNENLVMTRYNPSCDIYIDHIALSEEETKELIKFLRRENKIPLFP